MGVLGAVMVMIGLLVTRTVVLPDTPPMVAVTTASRVV